MEADSEHQVAKTSDIAVLLSPRRLIAEAEQATGLDDWGEPVFAPALERLCRSAIEEAGFDQNGAERFAANIHQILVKRLRLYADRARYPQITQQQISAPLIVTGLPRSGTTILHALLAQDPAARSPQKWEIDEPSPPPQAASYRTDERIARSQDAVERLPAQFRAMHAMGATLPEECNSIMTMAFLSPNFGAIARVSGYLRWLVEEADMAPAFDLHRHVLQHLQAFAPGRYWLLKAPPYLWWLDSVQDAYPDARIVITHRDPAQVIPSNSSLIAFLQGAESDEQRLAVGAEQLDIWHCGVDRMLDYRAANAGSETVCDSYYADFIRDPLAVVRNIYERFDMVLTDDALAAMHAFMSENRQDKHGKHEYSAAAYGLDNADIQQRFARYIDRFAIPIA